MAPSKRQPGASYKRVDTARTACDTGPQIGAPMRTGPGDLILPQTGLPQTWRMPHRLAVLALAAGAALLGAAPAQAGFHVCNKTNLATRVSLGHFDGKHWTSQGWWTIAPKDCAELIHGPLNARYYYLYATDGASGAWDGKTYFCTAPGAKFTIPGRGKCAARGFDKRGFFQVDTGQSPDWTQSLSN